MNLKRSTIRGDDVWQLQNNYAAVEGNGVKKLADTRCAVVQQSDGEVQVVEILTLTFATKNFAIF